AQYPPDRLSGRDLTPNDVDLPVEAAMSRDDLQPYAFPRGRRFHPFPGPGGGGRQAMLSAALADFDDDQLRGLDAERQPALADEPERDAQLRKRGFGARLRRGTHAARLR